MKPPATHKPAKPPVPGEVPADADAEADTPTDDDEGRHMPVEPDSNAPGQH